eukprot:m.487824 g.487824  ORF g.487824 m.487824 type:complete len:1238 (+) comp21757_c0_seq5:321-4034(+)
MESFNFSLVVAKSEASLGIKVEDAPHADSGVRLTEIILGGLIDTASRDAFTYSDTPVLSGTDIGVKAGDEVLTLNETSLLGKTALDMLELIQAIPMSKDIALEFRRERTQLAPTKKLLKHTNSLVLLHHDPNAVEIATSESTDGFTASNDATADYSVPSETVLSLAHTSPSNPELAHTYHNCRLELCLSAPSTQPTHTPAPTPSTAAGEDSGSGDTAVDTLVLPAWGAYFGPRKWGGTDGHTAKCVIADPITLCSDLQVPVAGSIVIAMRGGCKYYEKVLRAQAAGGIGVVVINAQGKRIRPMALPAEATPPDPVHIPSVLITHEAGEELLTALKKVPSGVPSAGPPDLTMIQIAPPMVAVPFLGQTTGSTGSNTSLNSSIGVGSGQGAHEGPGAIATDAALLPHPQGAATRKLLCTDHPPTTAQHPSDAPKSADSAVSQPAVAPPATSSVGSRGATVAAVPQNPPPPVSTEAESGLSERRAEMGDGSNAHISTTPSANRKNVAPDATDMAPTVSTGTPDDDGNGPSAATQKAAVKATATKGSAKDPVKPKKEKWWKRSMLKKSPVDLAQRTASTTSADSTSTANAIDAPTADKKKLDSAASSSATVKADPPSRTPKPVEPTSTLPVDPDVVTENSAAQKTENIVQDLGSAPSSDASAARPASSINACPSGMTASDDTHEAGHAPTALAENGTNPDAMHPADSVADCTAPNTESTCPRQNGDNSSRSTTTPSPEPMVGSESTPESAAAMVQTTAAPSIDQSAEAVKSGGAGTEEAVVHSTHPVVRVSSEPSTVCMHKATDGFADHPDKTGDAAPVIDTLPRVELPAFDGFVSHDSIVPCKVDTLYRILFCEREWLDEICRVKQTQDVSVGDWTGSEGTRARELGFTLALNIRIGPKTARAKDMQEEVTYQPGSLYVIKSEVSTPKVPYGESFFGRTYYILARDNDDQFRTHLRVYGEVVFTKSLWSITKHMIQKNGKEGMLNHWIDASRVLLDVVENQPASDAENNADDENNADGASPMETTLPVFTDTRDPPMRSPLGSPMGSGRSTPDQDVVVHAQRRSLAQALRRRSTAPGRHTDTPRRSASTLRHRTLPRATSNTTQRRSMPSLATPPRASITLKNALGFPFQPLTPSSTNAMASTHATQSPDLVAELATVIHNTELDEELKETEGLGGVMDFIHDEPVLIAAVVLVMLIFGQFGIGCLIVFLINRVWDLEKKVLVLQQRNKHTAPPRRQSYG